MNPKLRLPLATLTLLAALATTVHAQPVPVPNADFTLGDSAPKAWKLEGAGKWLDRSVLQVSGPGDDSSYWRCDGARFEPRALYRWQVRARRLGGSGTVILGPTFANRDFRHVGPEWEWHGFVFRTPESTRGGYLRVGQWHSTGEVQFDAVKLSRVVPVHARVGDLQLGEGESITGDEYRLLATFGHAGANYHRALESATAGFNSDRWTFGAGGQVTYRVELPGHALRSARLAFNVNYYLSGTCVAEVQAKGEDWREVGRKDGLGQVEVELPADLFPTAALRLRFRCASPSGSFQINRIALDARLDGSPPEGAGETAYAELDRALTGSLAGLEITDLELTARGETGKTLGVTLRNTEGPGRVVALTTTDTFDGRASRTFATRTILVGKGQSTKLTVPLDLQEPGRHELALNLRVMGNADVAKLSLAVDVPEYYRADYGHRIAGAGEGIAVWWCEAGWKISPGRAAPGRQTPTKAPTLEAARGDFEAVQVVVRPDRPLEDLIVSWSKLSSSSGAVIPSENLRILRVAYHDVKHPTDATGVRGRWPDALPPLRGPIDVPAGENQPLWVLVEVPRDAAPGEYAGVLRLRAEGWKATVPIALRVWDFELPVRNHIETAFGFSTGNVYRYHGLKTEADRRKVVDLYFECFSEHRISPYHPTPLDPIGVKFRPDTSPPRADLDFERFDRAMARAVNEFHFTGIRLPIQGMGGGTFHARYPPKILDYGEETPQYQAMFSSYVGQLERLFRERGWLDLAYIYWFDEPAPKDYEFVVNGMKRLDKYAPGLRRMLTEEPNEHLEGAVDIWCPVTHNFEDKAAKQRLAAGEKLWWYVCTGPKAPYCTLFIDHPATELRVWLWQSWKRDVTGILVWQSNYWTSSAAFPDEAQNPYEDPMGYVSGYSTPRGVKRHWGNGDGRFIYPPESAAQPGLSGADPVLERPASSIRWEMLREGVEDWEYLYLLRELLAKRRESLSEADRTRYEALLEVPPEISSNMTTFTKDPRPIHARRRAIAEAIERLSR